MGDGFKIESFGHLASLEENNFWFKARNRIIIWAIKKYSLNFNSFLEIGCGTGFVTQAIREEFPFTRLVGSEYFEEGLNFARQRIPNASFIQLDAREMTYEADFSIIGAFDVLEHIKEDNLVLKKINKALTKDGILFLTVPQHKWLWSKADDYACHERRYSSSELHEKIQNAGFEIIRSTSFVTTLLPVMLLARLVDKNKSDTDYDPTHELRISPFINKVMEYFMIFDLYLIKLGINLPIGGSRLIVVKKETDFEDII